MKNRLTLYHAVLWACVVCILAAAGCRKKIVETTVGIESPRSTWMRVRLFENLKECTISSANGFTVHESARQTHADFSTDESLSVEILNANIILGQHQFGPDIEIRTHNPYVIDLNGKTYRGYLRIRLIDDGSGLEVINLLPVEAYLLGVIGVEMYSYWEPESLKAQAVISRTYSLYIKNRFGSGRTWDVTATEANQVYRGVAAETATIRQAVLETAGQVLTETDPHGKQIVFPTYYSSSCGGHTEDAFNVFGDTMNSLSPVECSYCEIAARKKDFFWKPVHFTMDHIGSKLMERYPSLEKLEQIIDFEVIETGFQNRVTRVRLIGKNGKTDTLRGEDFRLSLDSSGRKLKSTFFTVRKNGTAVVFENGRGFGHGVGLCQHGAQEMARQGNDYLHILDFYFPGSTLVTVETTLNP